jgi:hypothetical protein
MNTTRETNLYCSVLFTRSLPLLCSRSNGSVHQLRLHNDRKYAELYPGQSKPGDKRTKPGRAESYRTKPSDCRRQLNEARDQIVPYLGATKYTIGQQQIQNQSQGSNAPFNQVILRAPGVAQDSFGQLHVRGEHANLQFRIDDVLIPKGITGFGSEIDTHWVKSVDLITGSLPAQFRFSDSGQSRSDARLRPRWCEREEF